MPSHHSLFNNPFEVKDQDVRWVDGLPHSFAYDDRFFQADAVKEIRNVFIEPNDLEKRFSTAGRLTIGELGFGFGLNFLVTAMIWGDMKDASNIDTLDYISIDEALPTKEQILRVIQQFPELQEVGEYFLSQYLPMHNDMHRIHLPKLNIRLTLIQNNAELALKNLLGFSNNLVDAWYLDGFDPSKNQAMWSSVLIQYIGMLSANEATFGTFTSAGFVKRNLQKFGFQVSKMQGFGNKRHKLIGKKRRDHSLFNAIESVKPSIAIIGSGIAGSSCAFSAANHGMSVDVFEYGQEVACGTSSNPVAAMYPRFSANNSPYAHLIAQSYFYADKLYANFPAQYKRSGLLFSHFNQYQAEWLESMLALKRNDIFQFIDETTMQQKFGLSSQGLKVLQGGYLFPQILCQSLLDHPSVNVFTDYCFDEVTGKGSNLKLSFSNQPGNLKTYDAVIIASGAGLLPFIPTLKISKGQLAGLTRPQVIAPNLPVNSEGYILPAINGVMWIGSTHDKDFLNLEASKESAQELISRTERNFNLSFDTQDSIMSEARLRVGSKDRLPIAGKLSTSQNIYGLGALGSRGFSLAPLLSEYIVSQISHAPNPISTALALSVDPQRFIS
jgi:tRNA 5-methylaminomethyl-2-thiouridine biosynthesis bifunctional protein